LNWLSNWAVYTRPHDAQEAGSEGDDQHPAGDLWVSKRARRGVVWMVACAAVLVIAACGGEKGGVSSGFAPRDQVSIRGQEINVLLPYQIPEPLLADFTRQTGVKVNLNITGWDAVRAKLIVANTAKTYIADVTEFDWSFTGQFAAARWYEPLEKVLDPVLVQDLSQADAAFNAGGHTYAVCYSNDYRLSLYNTRMFAAAGLGEFPKTFAELGLVVDKLKVSGVRYPLGIPMAATEGGVTPWYLLTVAMGGQLFDHDFKPLFADPGSAGFRALLFEVDAVRNGWVSPGSVTVDNAAAFDQFAAGSSAILFASSPGNLSTANNPRLSRIASDAKPALVPGVQGPGPTFGLPEGLAIPVTAKHKDAARAFIEWWMQPTTLRLLYKQAGMLPCRGSLVAAMARSGELDGGPVLSDELAHVVPLFPQGAPKWYGQFSSTAQGLLNAAVKGEVSVETALKQLAAKATELAGS
jgi:multiple sugar transport system substrate-binding protein